MTRGIKSRYFFRSGFIEILNLIEIENKIRKGKRDVCGIV